MKQLYIVSGCGVSALCEEGSGGMLWFIKRIIEKGGTPEMVLWKEEPLDLQSRKIA